MSLNWDLLAERILSHQRFILTSHIRPDCDALGSELGMAGILKQLGKVVRIVNGNPTPPSLSFLDPSQAIEVIGETTSQSEVDGDCLIVLDTSAWAQLGPMGEVLRKFPGTKLCIDHHIGEDDLGTEFFKDTSAEATGHLVSVLAEKLNVKITKPMATALYAAIATDTGWFRFGSTTAATYRIAAKLLESGAVPAEIYSDLYERDTLGRLRLRGRILARTEPELDGKLLHTYVLAEDFAIAVALKLASRHQTDGTHSSIQPMLPMLQSRRCLRGPAGQVRNSSLAFLSTSPRVLGGITEHHSHNIPVEFP